MTVACSAHSSLQQFVGLLPCVAHRMALVGTECRLWAFAMACCLESCLCIIVPGAELQKETAMHGFVCAHSLLVCNAVCMHTCYIKLQFIVSSDEASVHQRGTLSPAIVTQDSRLGHVCSMHDRL